MDLDTAIIGFGALAVCIVPLVYFRMNEKRKTKQFTAAFLHAAALQNLVISQEEVWGNFMGMGLDVKANKLFYFKQLGGKSSQITIDLNNAERCRAINNSRTVNDSRIIDRLEIGFSFRNSPQAEKTIWIYDKEESMSLNEELKLLEKWVAICQAQIKSSQTTNLAAKS